MLLTVHKDTLINHMCTRNWETERASLGEGCFTCSPIIFLLQVQSFRHRFQVHTICSVDDTVHLHVPDELLESSAL